MFRKQQKIKHLLMKILGFVKVENIANEEELEGVAKNVDNDSKITEDKAAYENTTGFG